MNLSQILGRDMVLPDLEVSSKKRVLQEASERLAAADPALDALEVYDALTERERLGSTALGHGVALPHCRLASCTQARGLLLQLRDGVDFGGTDRIPVRLIFALVVPEAATEEHLQILGLLAGAFSSAAYRARLLEADNQDELYACALDTPEQERSD